MTRTPPRLPRPLADHRTLRQPSERGITSPASGFKASHAQKSPNSSGVQYIGQAALKISDSAMVSMRSVRQRRIYVNDVYVATSGTRDSVQHQRSEFCVLLPWTDGGKALPFQNLW